MSTNKIFEMKNEELSAQINVPYAMLTGLFADRFRFHSELDEKLVFKKILAIGDIEAEAIMPKSTEIKQIAVGGKSSIYSKYFFNHEFTVSELQSSEGESDIDSQVLKADQIAFDKRLFAGDSVNNGLYASSDAFASHDTVSTAIATLDDFYSLLTSVKSDNEDIDGEKVLLLTGALATAWNKKLATDKVFKEVAMTMLGSEYTVAEVNSRVYTGTNSLVVVNKPTITLHLASLPKIWKKGTDERSGERWSQYMSSSCAVECLAEGALYSRLYTAFTA